MTCWLRYLQRVADGLKPLEPNLANRKRLGIEILKNLEREKGHDVVKIGKALDELGEEGLLKRGEAKLGKKKRRRTWIAEGEKEEATAQE